MSENCISCRFFQLAWRDELGHCRKNPPTVIPFEWSDEIGNSILQLEMKTVFPAVQSGDWCGLFEIAP